MLIYKSKLRIVLTIAYITTGTINIRTTKEIIGDLGDETGTRSQQIEEYKNNLSNVFKDTFEGTDISTGAKITDLSSVISQLQKDGELTTQSISNLAKVLPELNLNGKPAEEQITLLREAIDKLKNSKISKRNKR